MRALFILVTVGLLTAGAFWLHQQSQATVQPSRPVERRGSAVTIHAPGVVEGIGRQLDLRLEIAGRVHEIPVNDGDYVQAGQLLVQLDDATQRHQVSMLQGELEYAQARLERLKNGAHQQERLEARANHASRLSKLKHAEHELARSSKLLTKNAVGEQELDRWKAEVSALTNDVSAAQARLDLLLAPAREDDLRAAVAQVAVAQAKLELAKTDLARTQLRAPGPGQVLEVNRQPGELIELQDQQPVIVMADTTRLRVRAYVEELDAVAVRPGMTATITADGMPGSAVLGEVMEVMPRMSFKQVWTDRPDERFDVKTREVLIELRGASGQLPLLATAAQPDSRSDDNREPASNTALVYGLPVEVEIEPQPPAAHSEAMRRLR